jgi:hypothetical protein
MTYEEKILDAIDTLNTYRYEFLDVNDTDGVKVDNFVSLMRRRAESEIPGDLDKVQWFIREFRARYNANY